MRATIRMTIVLSLLLMLASQLVFAAEGIYEKSGYNYITAQALKAMLEQSAPVSLIDIQVEDEYAQHHLPGAIATHAYPVETDAEKAKIDAVLEQLAGDQPIVVICPRGGGGAKRCYDHLAAQGIGQDRLLILEKGQAQWDYPEYTEKQ